MNFVFSVEDPPHLFQFVSNSTTTQKHNTYLYITILGSVEYASSSLSLLRTLPLRTLREIFKWQHQSGDRNYKFLYDMGSKIERIHCCRDVS